MQWDCRLSTGLPQLCRLWSQEEVLQRAWNRDSRAVWNQVELSHCWHDGLVTVRDEAPLRRGHNDRSLQGHQCSETTLTGESLFTEVPPRDWTRVPHDGKQRADPLDQWDCVRLQWDCRLSTLFYFIVPEISKNWFWNCFNKKASWWFSCKPLVMSWKAFQKPLSHINGFLKANGGYISLHHLSYSF